MRWCARDDKPFVPDSIRLEAQIQPGGLERRDQSKEHRAADGRQQEEAEDAALESNRSDERERTLDEPLQRQQPPVRQHHPQEHARERQHQALDEQLLDDAGPAGPHRQPDGDLLVARGGLGEQEVGHIGAGDEQDERHRHLEDQQRGPHTPRHDLGQRQRRTTPPALLIRVGLLDALDQLAQLGVGGLERHTRRQPADNAQEAPAAQLGALPLGDEGKIEIHLGAHRELDGGGVDANHCVGLAIQRQRLADHVGGRTEAALPQPLAQHHDRRRAGSVLAREKPGRAVATRPASGRSWPRPRPPGAAPLPGGRSGCDPGGCRRSGWRSFGAAPPNHGSSARTPTPSPRAPCRFRLVDSDETLGVRVGQWAKQHRVHDAEDGRVGTNPQCQTQHGHPGEAWVLAEHPRREANILLQLTRPVHPVHPAPHDSCALSIGGMGAPRASRAEGTV